jgi:dynein light intermediate chain 2
MKTSVNNRRISMSLTIDVLILSNTFFRNLSAIIVIDLSRPEEMMATVDTLIEHVREKIDTILATEKHYLLKDTLRQRSKQRVGHQHEDVSDVNPILIPLMIIGSKFDVYQGFPIEKRKAINRYLRLSAHMNGGCLYYCSIRSEVAVNRIKGILNSFTFSPQDPIPASLDTNRPLVIPFGSDSFQLIGTVSLETARKEVTSLYPDQVVSKFVIPDNPAKDPKFKERDVDLVRDIRCQELEDYRRQKSGVPL